MLLPVVVLDINDIATFNIINRGGAIPAGMASFFVVVSLIILKLVLQICRCPK